MTIKVPLPGGDWAEMRDVSDLTGADQDAYYDKLDDLRARRETPGLPERPDPANPAVMLPAQPAVPGTLIGGDLRELRDSTLGRLITSWSLDARLPLTRETRRALPLTVCNVLYKAMEPMSSALSGAVEEDVPKPGSTPTEEQDGSGGSAGTSPDGTPTLLPAPAAVPSGTP